MTHKVISSTVSNQCYEELKIMAKLLYNNDKIEMPTISHLLRYIIDYWKRNGE